MFKVINRLTGTVIGEYSTHRRAIAARDRADNKHGAYIHTVKAVL